MDPNIHGTPIFMLQLPCEAIEKILSSMKTAPLLSRTEYSQDGFHHQRQRTHPKHCQTIDVGFLCKRCHLVCESPLLSSPGELLIESVRRASLRVVSMSCLDVLAIVSVVDSVDVDVEWRIELFS